MDIKSIPNSEIFNSVRAFMSPSFQDRIPQANIDNMKEIGTALTSAEFELELNAWQKALFNKIGLQLFYERIIQNRLAKYIYGNMPFTDAIEYMATDIVKGAAMNYGQDGESVDPFVKVSPQAKVEYHKVDEPIQYCTTIERDRLRRAFYNDGGLARLLGMFVNMLNSSANLDTWLLTKSIMAYYINDAKSGSLPLLESQKVTSADVTDEASAKTFLLSVKNTLSAMQFPNNAFNPQKIHKTLDNREITLFIRADILNSIGVNAMASAFNPEELNMNVKFEPMDDFGTDPNGKGTDDVLAVLAEDGWLLITQQLNEMDSIWNPRGRYWNYFLTRQMSFGTVYFKDAVIFRKSWD